MRRSQPTRSSRCDQCCEKSDPARTRSLPERARRARASQRVSLPMPRRVFKVKRSHQTFSSGVRVFLSLAMQSTHVIRDTWIEPPTPRPPRFEPVRSTQSRFTPAFAADYAAFAAS